VTDTHFMASKTAFDQFNAKQPLPWPSIDKVIGEKRSTRLAEKIKYYVRLYVAKAYLQPLLAAVNKHRAWVRLFEHSPKHFSAPLTHFIDNRWTMQQRFSGVQNDLLIAHRKWGTDTACKIAAGQFITLFEVPNSYSIQLSLNPVNFQEGYWSLMLLDEDQERVFNLTFCFLSSDTILIGSLQGGARKKVSNLETIQQLTKTAHGLRPPNLLLCAFQACCRLWGINSIFAIDHRTHVKAGWNHRNSGFKFDYQTFWQEAGGKEDTNNYWLLPNHPVKKEMELIQSKKRSQYKKRYQLMEDIEKSIVDALLD